MKKYTIEVFKGSDEQYYWRIKHNNENTLVTSEGYVSKAGAIEVAMRFYRHFNQTTADFEILD